MPELQHSEGLTRRDIIKKGAILGGTVMWVTPVVQTVGMSSALAQNPSDECTPQYAATVEGSLQGFRKGGDPIDPSRTDPDNATGPPDSDFFSLGYNPDGWIILKFNERAYKHTGSELLVVETTNGPWPPESALVEVSPDGSDWFTLGEASTQPENLEFDLNGIPYSYIQYVRLTNTTDPDPHTDADDGFDVNAVGITCP